MPVQITGWNNSPQLPTISVFGPPTSQLGTGGANISFSTPTGISQNDFIVVSIIRLATSTVTAPTGFSPIASTSTSSPCIDLYGKTWNTGDPTSYSFSWSTATNYIGREVTYRPSSGTIYVDGTPSTTNGNSSILSYNSVTPTGKNDVLIYSAVQQANDTSFSTPAGMTSEGAFAFLGSSNTALTGAYFDRILSSNAAIGSNTTTSSNSAAWSTIASLLWAV